MLKNDYHWISLHHYYSHIRWEWDENKNWIFLLQIVKAKISNIYLLMSSPLLLSLHEIQFSITSKMTCRSWNADIYVTYKEKCGLWMLLKDLLLKFFLMLHRKFSFHFIKYFSTLKYLSTDLVSGVELVGDLYSLKSFD